jgi:hypothetical protein
MVSKFICGLCNSKKVKVFVGTRKGLRQHLREEHRIMKEITNRTNVTNNKKSTQNWWKKEEMQ